MGLLLDKGQRGLLVGQTGSGKTQNALFQLANPCSYPVIIFDTKIEDAFFGLRQDGYLLDVVEDYGSFEKYSKLPKKQMADYILVRPSVDEIQDYGVLSQYALLSYDKFGPCYVYFDELYSWHNKGQPTNGMIGLYTRGRSRGKTVLGATQRPSWISRFCLTEAQKFYIHSLIDQRDRKTLGEVIPGIVDAPPLPPYFFYHYAIGGQLLTYQPVPPTTVKKDQIFKTNWL